jgi:acetyltransferase-like isoleucine patch superfamily enzyme
MEITNKRKVLLANEGMNGIFIPSRDPMSEPLYRRIRWRHVLALFRYMRLRLGHPFKKIPLFYLGPRSVIEIGEKANIYFGKKVLMLNDFFGHFWGNIVFGDNVRFGKGCRVSVHSTLTIGNNTGFAEYVSIHDANHIVRSDGQSYLDNGFIAYPIHIGSNVWVGAKATILSGVTIGDNVIIGANSVVTHDIPANAIAVGIPARIIRYHE